MDRRQFCCQLFGSSLALTALTNLALGESPRLPFPGGGGAKVKWQKSLKTAQKLAIQQDKPIMIVFGATWCTYCHKLERETLGERHTAAYVDRQFIPVLLDYNKDAKAAEILEVERLPCTIILTPEADLLLKLEGFREPKDYQASLATALEKRNEIQQAKATAPTR